MSARPLTALRLQAARPRQRWPSGEAVHPKGERAAGVWVPESPQAVSEQHVRRHVSLLEAYVPVARAVGPHLLNGILEARNDHCIAEGEGVMLGPVNTLSGFSHVALTVTDIEASRRFYAEVLGMPVLDSSDTYCALLTESGALSGLILTTHAETMPGAFSEFRVGLDHVSFAVPDESSLSAWQDRLQRLGVAFDARRSEWGHHVNFRDPDNIAVELVVLDPDADVQRLLDAQEERST